MSGPAEQLLRTRAAALARREELRNTHGELVVLFARGGRTHAIRGSEIEAVARLKNFWPVPGAPSWVRGAVLHRGAVTSLVDLPAFWGEPPDGARDLNAFVVVTHRGARLALLAEELLGVEELDGEPGPWRGQPLVGVAALAAVRDRPVMLLSAASLFDDPRLRS